MTQYTFDEDLISDLHKDAYGFRPSQSFWAIFAAANADQKQAIWDDLLDTLDATIAREKADEERAIKEFNERISVMMKLGAKDFAQAIRWLHEAYDTHSDGDVQCDTGGDVEFLEFRMGLPYGYIRKARAAAQTCAA